MGRSCEKYISVNGEIEQDASFRKWFLVYQNFLKFRNLQNDYQTPRLFQNSLSDF